MTRYSFNLVDQPWIPCVQKDGKSILLNLRDTFAQAHNLQAVVGDAAPVTVALHRFMLAILHSVFGPANRDEWATLWTKQRWDTDALDTYLNKWKPHFDLFDLERPFYQSATLYLESGWVSARRLVHHLGSMNLLFDHHDEANGGFLTPDEVARALLTVQGFGLCGTSGAFYPRASPRDKKIQGMFADGAIARGINFLVQGKTLFETLMLNLVEYPSDRIVVHFDDDAPSWELDDPCSPERGLLTGYLDYLTWQNRRILLQPETDSQGKLVVRNMRWEPANRLDPVPRDSMQHHIKKEKEGFRLLLFNEDRVLWRDSAALLSLHNRNSSPSVNYPPATFQWLKELVAEKIAGLTKSQILQCVALGMSSKPGQAAVYFYREERIPLPVDYFSKPDLVVHLHAALDQTDEVLRGLRFAAQIMGMYKQIPDADAKKWQDVNRSARNVIFDWIKYSGLERRYWTDLDIPFQSFIVDLSKDAEKALAGWHRKLKQSAESAFELATQYVGDDAQSLKAIVHGRAYLAHRLREILPIPNKEKPYE